jgi:phosphomethylpyrimidine synthase
VREDEALARGMAAKSAEFKAAGGEFYVPVESLMKKA